MGVHHSLKGLMIAFLALSVSLSGCLSGAGLDSERLVHDGPIRIDLPADLRRCDDELVRNCDELADNPEAAVVVGGFDVQMHLRDSPFAGEMAGHGLMLQSLDRDLIIEDITFRGDGTGIRIGHPDGPFCTNCTITVRNVVMEQVRGGIWYDDAGPALVVRDSTINLRTGGDVGGQTFVFTDNATQQNTDSLIAIQMGWMFDDDIRLEMERVSLRADPPSNGTAISVSRFTDADSMRPLRLHDVEIAGFGTGIEYRGSYEADFENIRIDCGFMGIDSAPLHPDTSTYGFDTKISASRVAIDGCSEAGIRTYAEEVSLKQLNITNSNKAIQVLGGDRITLDQFHLQGNGYGLFLEGDSSAREWARITNGEVRDSLYRGIHTKTDVVTIDNVGFYDNGHSWPDPTPQWWNDEPDEDPTSYGGLVMRYSTIDPEKTSQMVVRNSTFSGNEPYGLVSFEFRGGTDATLNCWGHPTGPRVLPSLVGVDPTVGPGLGDAVNEFVRYHPFLPCQN